jgi:hypothetical protein
MKKAKKLAAQRLQRQAAQLELSSFGCLGFLAAVLHLVLGSSVAVRMAWLQALFSSILPAVFLATVSVKGFGLPRDFLGNHRRIREAIFRGALLMLAMSGLFLMLESFNKLAQGTHPTIGTVWICQRPVWLGWMMLLALGTNTGVQFLLDRLKRPLAAQLPGLAVEAGIHRLGWMTSLTAEIGLTGLLWGWWWADSVAGACISLAVCLVSLRSLNAQAARQRGRQTVRRLVRTPGTASRRSRNPKPVLIPERVLLPEPVLCFEPLLSLESVLSLEPVLDPEPAVETLPLYSQELKDEVSA